MHILLFFLSSRKNNILLFLSSRKNIKNTEYCDNTAFSVFAELHLYPSVISAQQKLCNQRLLNTHSVRLVHTINIALLSHLQKLTIKVC